MIAVFPLLVASISVILVFGVIGCELNFDNDHNERNLTDSQVNKIINNEDSDIDPDVQNMDEPFKEGSGTR